MKTQCESKIGVGRSARKFSLRATVVLLALALFAAMLRPVPAATVTLQQGVLGYTGNKDAWLDESSKRDNNGGDTKLRIQYNSGLSDSTLIRFDLPSLSFQTVSAATLSLYLYDTYSMVREQRAGDQTLPHCGGPKLGREHLRRPVRGGCKLAVPGRGGDSGLDIRERRVERQG